MAEATMGDRPKRRLHGEQAAGVAVAATQLGKHLDLSHQRICVLADVEHVVVRLPNGRFDQNDARIRYLRWLRDPERRSATDPG